MRRPRPKEPSRPFQPVSLQPFPLNPPRQHAFRVEHMEGTTTGETTTENDAQVSISISFRSDFATVLRAPCCVYDGYTICDFTIDTTTASGQPVRFFCLVRTTTATRPAWFPSLYPIVSRPRSSLPPISRIRFPRMTIAQRTTLEPVTPLSNFEAPAMPKTPTTTCTFPTPGCPLRANSSRHPGTEGTSMDIA